MRPYNETMQQNRKTTRFPVSTGRLYTDAAGLLLAFLLTLTRIAGVTAPFGLSLLFAFEMCGLPAVFPLLGVLTGAFVGGEPLWGTMLGGALFVLLGTVYKRMVGSVPSEPSAPAVPGVPPKSRPVLSPAAPPLPPAPTVPRLPPLPFLASFASKEPPEIASVPFLL